LPETDVSGASAIAQRAIDAVDALRIRHAACAGGGHITLSVGGGWRDSSRSTNSDAGGDSSSTPLDGNVPDDLITAAEQALGSAKSAGGHRARLVDIAELRDPPEAGTLHSGLPSFSPEPAASP
jgi:GGDEF domain-containing protein